MTNSGSHSHTPALPIHNGQNYQELKREREKERDSYTQPTANLTLVSNNNEWTPQILRNQIWVTLTHTPALPIHNGRNYQELKRESDTGHQPTVRLSLKESERERDRTLKKAHFIPECRNKLQKIQCQFKLNRTSHVSTPGAEIHHSRVGERKGDRMEGGIGREKRVRGPVSECER